MYPAPRAGQTSSANVQLHSLASLARVEASVLIFVGLAMIIVLTVATGYFVAQEFAYVAVDRGGCRRWPRRVTPPPHGRSRSPPGSRSCSPAPSWASRSPRCSPVTSPSRTSVRASRTCSASPACPRRSACRSSVVVGAAVRHRRADGARRAGAEEPGDRQAGGAGAGAVPVDADLPGGRRPADPALRRGLQPAAAPRRASSRSRSCRRAPPRRTWTGSSRARTREGLLDADTSRLLDRGLDFRGRTAGEAMVPRVDVVTVRATTRRYRVVELLDTGHTRFPVIGDAVDDVRRRGRDRRRGRPRTAPTARTPPVGTLADAAGAGAGRRCRCRRCWSGCAPSTASSPAWSTSTAGSPAS